MNNLKWTHVCCQQNRESCKVSASFQIVSRHITHSDYTIRTLLTELKPTATTFGRTHTEGKLYKLHQNPNQSDSNRYWPSSEAQIHNRKRFWMPQNWDLLYIKTAFLPQENYPNEEVWPAGKCVLCLWECDVTACQTCSLWNHKHSRQGRKWSLPGSFFQTRFLTRPQVHLHIEDEIN